jgi:hypothetical protein
MVHVNVRMTQLMNGLIRYICQLRYEQLGCQLNARHVPRHSSVIDRLAGAATPGTAVDANAHI